MDKKIVNNYGSFETVFVNGNNATLFDSNGKKYIDFIAGIGVNSLGHNHKDLVSAIKAQVEKEIHISNYYFSDVGLSFASELLSATKFSGAYFGNSGAEANEAAIKLARKYGYLNGGDKRKIIYTLEKSFHGRTMATLSATGQTRFHPECFAPYLECFRTIKANDWSAIENTFDDTSAALFIECVQGEGGVNLIDEKWAKAISNAAHKSGAIVMVDEVQTGVGRCGSFLASDMLGIEADVVTLAKGIAGGIPMGACLFRNKANNVFTTGDHQSTFAGNPLACAASRVVLSTINSKDFLEKVCKKGEYIRNTIKEWNSSIIKDIRGRGLMIGIEIDEKVKPFDVESICLNDGLCVSIAGQNVIRFLPPLTITMEEIDDGLKIFKNVLKQFA